MFRIQLSNRAEHFLNKTAVALRERLVARMERLALSPFPRDCVRIANWTPKTFRVRVGDYRILYQVYFENREILIVTISERENVYD